MTYVSRSWNMLANPNASYSWAEAGNPMPFSIGAAIYSGPINGIVFPLAVLANTTAPGPGGQAIPISYGSSAYGFFGPLNLIETPKVTINCISCTMNPTSTDGKWNTSTVSNKASLLIGYATSIPALGTTTTSNSPRDVIVWESYDHSTITDISTTTFTDYQYTIPSVASGSKYLVICASSSNASVFVKSLTLSS